MFKYAFLANSAGLGPDKYSVTYENDRFCCYISAVHGMKMPCEIAEKLAAEGFELIDLCGDFNLEKAEEIRKAADGKLNVCYAKYTEENQKKYDALESMNEYGIIIMGEGIGDKPEKLELRDDEYNTYVTIVGSDEMAKAAAKEMVAQGIHFIELCSYFDLEKAEAIADTVDRKVPFGYCG